MQLRISDRSLLTKLCYLVMLGLLYWAAAVVSTNSFMARWGFRENAEGVFGFETMLNGDATRPWAYRVLVPAVVNDLSAPLVAKSNVAQSNYFDESSGVRERYYRGAPERWQPAFRVKYHIAIGIIAASLFAFLWLLRSLATRFGIENGTLVDLGPLCFAVLLPMAFLKGGYMYDFPELLLLGTCFLAAVTIPVALIILVPIAVLNKETAILVPVMLAPLLVDLSNPRRGLAIFGGALFTALAAYLSLRHLAANNPGGTVEYHLHDNLAFWLNPRSYVDFSMMLGAGMPLPKMHTLVVFIPLAVLTLLGWKHASTNLRRVFLICLVLNAPLLLLFGDKDELRNLSLLFIPLYLLVLHAAQAISAALPARNPS